MKSYIFLFGRSKRLRASTFISLPFFLTEQFLFVLECEFFTFQNIHFSFNSVTFRSEVITGQGMFEFCQIESEFFQLQNQKLKIYCRGHYRLTFDFSSFKCTRLKRIFSLNGNNATILVKYYF